MERKPPLVRSASRAISLAKDLALGRQRPRLLTHIVTFRCNARCGMCDSWRRDGRQDLDASAIEAIYHKLPSMDAVRLTGGEPFARADFPRIAGFAQRILRPLVLHITTNGFLTRPIVEYCRRRDPSVPLHLMVSLDGRKAVHDRIRGKAGAWESALATLGEVAALGGEANIRLSVNQTIVEREGIEEIQPLSELLSELGAEHQVVLAYASSGTYSDDWGEEGERDQIGTFTPLAVLDEADRERLLSAMERLEEGAGFEVRLAKSYYRRGLAQRLRGKPSIAPPCAALGRHLRLLPDGSVPVCQFNPRVVGNLVRQDLSQLRASAPFVESRRWVEKCRGCWAECEALPSALYSGDLLRHAAGLPPRRVVEPQVRLQPPGERVGDSSVASDSGGIPSSESAIAEPVRGAIEIPER
jgi:Fe-coproporphyrin III synthase